MSMAEVISSFSRARVAVFGDIMLDRFVFGEVLRISPEAPIPILRVQREEEMLGGAGNVARNIAMMGGYATLLAALGHDSASATIDDLVARQPRLATMLVREKSRTTAIKTRFVAQGQHLLRVDCEVAIPIRCSTEQKLLSAFASVVAAANTLVLSDYAKGGLTDAMISQAISAARARGVPVIVDSKTEDFRRYAGATVITPNAQEAARATGIDCNDDDGVRRAASALLAIVGCRAVVVTRGAKGMTVLFEAFGKNRIVHLPTEAREVYDVSGAGDTVVAALTLALSVGASFEEAVRLANIAGGIAVAKVGTTAVKARELARSIPISEIWCESQKIVDLETAAAAARSWRLNGLRVILTNGCFDLLHLGHVRLLHRAKAEGDKLVVALNCDRSVRRLKGSTRPIQKEAARAAVMASIGVVDLVVIFTESTPLRAIEAIRPDVLVKGSDYTQHQVVGGDFVRAIGGRVVLVPLEEGQSTTIAIQRAAAEVSRH
jgi:D-beta-D-heptose 7-phosphate kinase / D-beta-D-heptose 1-phosphate adenosyltransferase